MCKLNIRNIEIDDDKYYYEQFVDDIITNVKDYDNYMEEDKSQEFVVDLKMLKGLDMYKKKKKKKKKVRHKTCLMVWKKKTSNYYLTITDLRGKVLFYISSGKVNNTKKKKIKVSHILVYSMLHKVVNVLQKHKIRNIIFILKSPISKHIYNLFVFFKNRKYSKYKFVSFWFLKPTPHHFGQRKKKPRRV